MQHSITDFADCCSVPDPDTANCGSELADRGSDTANCGPDLADCGPDVADRGPDVADCGPDPTDCGPDLTDCSSDVADGITFGTDRCADESIGYSDNTDCCAGAPNTRTYFAGTFHKSHNFNSDRAPDSSAHSVCIPLLFTVRLANGL